MVTLLFAPCFFFRFQLLFTQLPLRETIAVNITGKEGEGFKMNEITMRGVSVNAEWHGATVGGVSVNAEWHGATARGVSANAEWHGATAGGVSVNAEWHGATAGRCSEFTESPEVPFWWLFLIVFMKKRGHFLCFNGFSMAVVFCFEDVAFAETLQ